MEQIFSLKEVSRMFDIPVTTLRYWERRRLIPLRRNINNNYKEFLFDELAYVCDMDIYHKSGWNKQELEHLYTMELEGISDVLSASQSRLERELEKIRSMQAQIEKRLATIERIRRLSERPYLETDLPMEKIVAFPENHEDFLQYGKQALTDFASVITYDDDENHGYQNGRVESGFHVSKDFSYGKVLFEKNCKDKDDDRYIVFLGKFPVTQNPFPYKLEKIHPLLLSHIEEIAKQYQRPETFITRYLITAYDEEIKDICQYNEVYAKLES